VSQLVTLDEYKTALGITGTADDAKHDAALSAAEQAVVNFTQRDFTKTLVGGVDEVQTISLTGNPTGGHFTLTFNGQTTSNIQHNASAATVFGKLENLSTIAAGAITVTGNAGGPWTVTFIGELGSQNVSTITGADTLTGGTSPAVSVTTTTSGVAGSSVTDRTFWLEPGSAFLEIDDCTVVNDVTGLGIATWEERTEGPSAAHGIYTYIQLEAGYQTSVEMGFERNEDIFGTQQASTLGTEVTVNADWGWGSVPSDVKRAIIWTAASFEKDTDNPYGSLSQKRVAEVSETYYIAPPRPDLTPEAVPLQAQALLLPYRRLVL
jgi:hypothetical protein